MDDSRLDGIKFDVGGASQKVDIFFDQEAFEAVLPEVPHVRIFLLVIKGVGQVEFLHGGRQRRARKGSEHQMDVIGHEAIVVEPEGMNPLEAGQDGQVGLEIAPFVENGLAVIAPCEDVEDAFFWDDSWAAGHGDRILFESRLNGNQK